MRLEFGKYRGKAIEDVPSDYLLWLFYQTRQTRKNLKVELNRRGVSIDDDDTDRRRPNGHGHDHIPNIQGELYQKVFLEGFRVLALKFHPDKAGGNVRLMQELNELRDRFKKEIKGGK